MQIAFHIGANCTDDDRLLKSLIKNADNFASEGIKVPGPGKYRRIIRETIQNLNGAAPAADTREILLDAILDDQTANRLVMTNSAFICVSNRIFENGVFYEQAEAKIAGLRSLFPNDDLEIFLSIRNPATFIPAALVESKHNDVAEFLHGVALENIRWSALIARIQAAVPNAALTVWCNEDTPFIWAQLIREISGVDPLTKITGGYDLIGSIMSAEGMSRFMEYIKENPPRTEIQKRRIIAAFLDKFALEDQVVEEVDMPGWTTEIMDRLTEVYEEDIFEISRMPGINLITP